VNPAPRIRRLIAAAEDLSGRPIRTIAQGSGKAPPVVNQKGLLVRKGGMRFKGNTFAAVDFKGGMGGTARGRLASARRTIHQERPAEMKVIGTKEIIQGGARSINACGGNAVKWTGELNGSHREKTERAR